MGEPGLYSGNRHRHIPLPSMGHYFRSSRGSRHWRTVGWQTHTRSSQSRAGRFCRISLGSNFKGIALRLFRGCLHLCSILISFPLSFSHKLGRTSTVHCWQVKGSLILKWKVLPKRPISCVVKHKRGGLDIFPWWQRTGKNLKCRGIYTDIPKIVFIFVTVVATTYIFYWSVSFYPNLENDQFLAEG